MFERHDFCPSYRNLPQRPEIVAGITACLLESMPNAKNSRPNSLPEGIEAQGRTGLPLFDTIDAGSPPLPGEGDPVAPSLIRQAGLDQRKGQGSRAMPSEVAPKARLTRPRKRGTRRLAACGCALRDCPRTTLRRHHWLCVQNRPGECLRCP